MNTIGAAALGAGAAGLGLVAIDPYYRGTVQAGVKGLISKKDHHVEENKQVPRQAVIRADAVAKYLKSQGLNPKTHTIGISATGGTGKSTMARLLADKFKMRVSGERTKGEGDFANKSSREYAKMMRTMKKVPKGTIYEQTHMLPNANPDLFNAMIYLHRDKEDIFKSLKKRKRAAALRHVTDYPLLDSVIRNSYDNAKGKDFSPSEGVHVKMKPSGGYGATEIVDKKLIEAGFKKADIKEMNREDKMYALAGAPGKTDHLLSKLLSPEYRPKGVATALGIVGGGAVLGGLARNMMKS